MTLADSLREALGVKMELDASVLPEPEPIPVRPMRDYGGGRPRKHLVIPDTQVKPGVALDHFDWIGRYILDQHPDVLVHLGDHFDNPSLSSYDRGKKAMENRRWGLDLAWGNAAMRRLWAPLRAWNTKQRKGRRWWPEAHYTTGNHDYRVVRMVEDQAQLEGVVGPHLYDLSGFAVHPFLKPVVVDGIAYCHYFPRAASGLVVNGSRGAPSAKAQVEREGQSCTAGHRQGLDTHIKQTGSRTMRGVIAGSCYLHDEEYETPQGHRHWHGVLVKHEVHDGDYDLMEVSLDFLRRKFS